MTFCNPVDLDGVLGNSGIVGGLRGSDGVVDNVVSAVDDLLDDLFDVRLIFTSCCLALLQNNFFYHFNLNVWKDIFFYNSTS